MIKKSSLILLSVFFINAVHAAEQNPHIIPGELLIKYKSDSQLNKMSASIRYKASARSQFKTLDVEHWKLPDSSDVNEVVQQLKNDPAVDFVEPNYRRYPRAIDNSVATNSANERLVQINLRKLWDDVPIRRTTKVKIAVIDDGFDIDHPDLAANVTNTYDALDGDTDPRPETCVDELGNVVTDPNTLSTTEDHGTQVLGVLGAVTGNETGIDGSGDNAAIYTVRVGCQYTVAAELAAVNWAIQNDVDIISVSYGGPMFSEFEREAFQKALAHEIVVVVAAGNFDMNNDLLLDYPSGLDLPNILSVAATDEANNLAEWSQWGQTKVHIAAPGESIGTTYHASNSTELYAIGRRGTSFSAPMVAGVLASLMQRDVLYASPGSVFRAKAALLSSAKSFPDGGKARLATSGYADAMAAYTKMELLEPVILIKSISVDDSSGNNNGEVDPGEIVNLKVTLENQGADANSFSAILSSSSLDFSRQVDSSISGYRSSSQSYGKLEVSFDDIEFGTLAQQNILFKLDISGIFAPGTRKFSTTRYFSINSASLEIGVGINSVIKKKNNLQDDAQFYHVDIPSNAKDLVFTLTTSIAQNKVDLIVKYGSIPQFDYFKYTNYKINQSAIDTGVLVSLMSETNGNNAAKKLVIKAPKAGTYYVVAVVDSGQKETDLAYTLKAEFSSDSKKQAAGCSAGRNNPFDPMLIVLCLIAITKLSINRKQQKV